MLQMGKRYVLYDTVWLIFEILQMNTLLLVYCQLCKKVGFFHNKNVHMIDSILNLLRQIFQLEKKVAKTLLYFKLLIYLSNP